jgi:hypothetical protein
MSCRRWLESLVQSVQADIRGEIVAKLGRLGQWELEDYTD